MFKDRSIYTELRGIYDEYTIPCRIAYLKYLITQFIKLYDLGEIAVINYNLICGLVVDYYADIVRLKDFHNIEYTNFEKIIAYTAYWLHRRKPIQLISNRPNDLYTYINEMFIASFVTDGISNLINSNFSSAKIRDFLFYHLKYRLVDAQNLEMMITSCVSTAKMGNKY